MLRLVLNHIQLLISVVYLGLAGLILLVKLIKPLNDLLLYGKTYTSTTTSGNDNQSRIHKLIHILTSHLKVPKSFFTHFYILLSISSSISLFVIQYPLGSNPHPTKYKNLFIINTLLWLQGVRRLFECLFMSKFSKTSYINISHYIAGMLHYILISLTCYLGKKSYSDSPIGNITVVDGLLIISYIILAKGQFNNHYHLSHLVKYSLPNFQYVASPHYLQEILIYTVLFIFSVKHGWDSISRNFLCALVFVTINLSISSIETYRYYQVKFKDEFKLEWCIIPGVL
ncbi:Polyprenol reductase [Spathaspora sp. JA1]|nr:Polyprenol reductase [Spathaspora sp. JA1]